MIAMCGVLMSQTDSTQKEINRDLNKTKRQDMLLVDLNWDYLMGLQSPVTQKWYGRGIAVSLMYDHPLLEDGRVSFGIGGGFASHNYYTNARVEKIDSLNVAHFKIQTEAARSGGKISVNYVDVPIEFRFRTQPDDRGHQWKLAVGGRVGYLLNVHEKNIDGEGFKTKTYHFPHVAKFRFGPTMRIGYGAIMVTTHYSASTFFQPNKGLNKLNGLTVGLTISPF